MQKPDWLPDMISMDGEWNAVLSGLYAIFDHDFKQGKPTLNKMTVWWNQRIEKDGIYEEGFWHLISDGRSGCPGVVPFFLMLMMPPLSWEIIRKEDAFEPMYG